MKEMAAKAKFASEFIKGKGVKEGEYGYCENILSRAKGGVDRNRLGEK
jgi:hypothetical protein